MIHEEPHRRASDHRDRGRELTLLSEAPWVVGQGPPPTTGNGVEFLIDNEAAWGRLAEEIGRAADSVRAMLFMLDVPNVRLSFDRPLIGNPGAVGGVRIEECLIAAADRGAAVTVLINHVLPTISPANTTRAIERYFRDHDPAGRIQLVRLVTPQSVPIHAKIFVIDDRVAYLVGSGFAQEYFDGRRHLIDDPRRGRHRWRSSILAPVHDVSARIEGPAVADLDEVLRLHWRHARPDETLPPGRPLTNGPAGDIRLQVTRTLHGRRYAELPDGETGVFESYQRALRTAKRFIYLENQYFTCFELVDELVGALLREPDLELIGLINMRADIPGYVAWQRAAIERLWAGLGDQRKRAGIFTLWSHEPGQDGRTTLLRTYIHSKLAIVDDDWLTLGSANLDGVSLLASEHARDRSLSTMIGRLVGAFGDGDPRDARSSEVNVTCAGPPGGAPREIGRLRRHLWAEHLGYGVDSTGGAGDIPALAQPPPPGWLSLWRERADEKLAGLRAPEPTISPSRILPYPDVAGRAGEDTHRPDAYLRALGVAPERFEMRNRSRSFSFARGEWA